MSDKRCIRFSSLGQLSADDLQLAVDVWLDDALKAPWATKDTMKLAGVLCRYMIDPAGDCLNMKSVEDLYQLNADVARRSLVLFSLYGMIDAFTIEHNELRAGLRLSELQNFRILQIKREMSAMDSGMKIRKSEIRWLPEATESEEAALEPAVSAADAETPAALATAETSAIVDAPAAVDAIAEIADPAPQVAALIDAAQAMRAGSMPMELNSDSANEMAMSQEPATESTVEPFQRSLDLGGDGLEPRADQQDFVFDAPSAAENNQIAAPQPEPQIADVPQAASPPPANAEPERVERSPRRRGLLLQSARQAVENDDGAEDNSAAATGQDALSRSLQRLQRRMSA